MVYNFLFLQLFADTLESAHLFPGVEMDFVGCEFGCGFEAVVDGMAEGFFIPFHGDGVDQDDVGFEGIVISFPEFDLPGAKAFGIVEDIFEGVEIDEGAFEFVDVEVFEIGDS